MTSSSNADVLIGVSLEAGVLTDTLVSSKLGQADSAKSEASLEVQVLVGGKPASPGNVIFAKRAQSMMEVFGDILGPPPCRRAARGVHDVRRRQVRAEIDRAQGPSGVSTRCPRWRISSGGCRAGWELLVGGNPADPIPQRMRDAGVSWLDDFDQLEAALERLGAVS
jgi:hypothetical protein